MQSCLHSGAIRRRILCNLHNSPDRNYANIISSTHLYLTDCYGRNFVLFSVLIHPTSMGPCLKGQSCEMEDGNLGVGAAQISIRVWGQINCNKKSMVLIYFIFLRWFYLKVFSCPKFAAVESLRKVAEWNLRIRNLFSKVIRNFEFYMFGTTRYTILKTVCTP
jgi:hypothetical protein